MSDAEQPQVVAEDGDDARLDELLDRLAEVPGSANLLLGVSVYHEVVDYNAILFQIGQPDPDAEDIPDHKAACGQIDDILAASGITIEIPFDLANVPSHIQALLAPHIAELNRRPIPPFRPGCDLEQQIAACHGVNLLTVSGEGDKRQFFVHRWIAAELAGRAASRAGEAHRQAAAYWIWRSRVWRQDIRAAVRDLQEARRHLLLAGDTEDAGQLTQEIIGHLHSWGAWDQEASLIHDTLALVPTDSPLRAHWVHQLGILAQARGDHDEAARLYHHALNINERSGNQVGIAAIYHQLGNVAYLQGYHDEAASHYQRSLEINERLGNQTRVASSYHQLGVLAQARGDHNEAALLYQRALDINERLGNHADAAGSYRNLGVLAQARGVYDEAARLYHRALDIYVRLDNQPGVASSYHLLGRLAKDRRDYDEATRLYRRELDINERLGKDADAADSYHNLGVLAQARGDHNEAARLYRSELDINERLGNQPGVASGHSMLGVLAYDRGDYDEAARLYRRALDINERLVNDADAASSYHNLGMVAQALRDYDEANRLYQRALNINERLDNQVGVASSYSQLGILEKERGGSITSAVTWHVGALMIRLLLRAPQAMIDMRYLATYRRELGVEQFSILLVQAVGDSDRTKMITSLLDRFDRSDDSTA